MLTQAELKSYLHYSPDTGIFTRIYSASPNAKIGHQYSCVGSNGYINIRIQYKNRLAHRLAWLYIYGEWPKEQIDHINGIKTDNRICNLRQANNSQNNLNIGIQKNNTSGYKCVAWIKHAKKWRASCWYNNKNKFLGYFSTAEQASEAYEAFAKLHLGEFHRS